MGLLKLNLNLADLGPRVVLSAQQSARYAVDLVKHCARELKFDNAEQMAAALTYRTIFSLIPMFVLGLLVFNAFTGFEGARTKLQETLFNVSGVSSLELPADDKQAAAILQQLDYFDPSPEAETQPATQPIDAGLSKENVEGAKLGIKTILSNLLDKVSGLSVASIGIVGLLLFLYAAIGLAISMESSFNTIYSAPKGRPWHMRVTIYWAAITLGPVLLFVSLYMGGKLTEAVSRISTTPAFESSIVGTVAGVDKVQSDTFVEVKLGKNHGAQKDMKFLVQRGEEQIGSLKLDSIDADGSSGRMRLIDGAVEAGDRVLSAAGHGSRPSIVLYTGAFLATLLQLLSKLTPLLASWLLLFIIYRLVPNTKVQSRAALIGSFVAAGFWELGKILFQLYVKKAVPYNAIYGSLGLVPLFLFWIYITWMIVLFGLELSYTLQVMKTGQFKYAEARSARDMFYDTRWLIPMMGLIARAFREGKVITREDLARELALPIRLVVCLGDDLEAAGFIHRAETGDEEGPGYSLTKPAESIQLSQLVDLSRSIANAATVERRSMTERAEIPGWAFLDKLTEKQQEAAGAMSLGDLLNAQCAASAP